MEKRKKKNKRKTKEELIKEYAYGNRNQIETAFPKQVQYSHKDQFKSTYQRRFKCCSP
jgi:hypothetical protein